ncbi:MAG: hypothetical protein Kow0010_10680 [Dehalococcoidia bacterium]
MADLETLRSALCSLYADREHSEALARTLGMTPQPNPVNLAGGNAPIANLLSGRISELYRVGEARLGLGRAGLYLAFADEWHDRSAMREPYRRKLARALVEHRQNDGRWLAILMDHRPAGSPMAEFILPRRREGSTSASTTRALVNLKRPSRFHLELLRDLDTSGHSAELIKPWLRGQDIKRWKAEWAGLYVIFTRRGTDIEQYPAIKAHLEQWRDQLTPKQFAGQPGPGRKPGDYKWCEIQDNVAYYKEFEEPKVIWPRNVPPYELRFAYEPDPAYLNDKGYMLVGLERSWLAYLNSPLALWLLEKMTTKLRGGWIELKSDSVVGKLPMVATLRDLNTNDDEGTVHAGVADALGLQPDERRSVWEWYQEQQIYRSDVSQDDDDNDSDE